MHRIGKELADKVLGGRYEYVLTTHIDKGHIHNHIIFCAVDFMTHRKYVSNKKSYYQIRNESDRLCKEHGLSVVIPGQDKGKKYAEWDAERKGTSWKAKRKAVIDDTIPKDKLYQEYRKLKKKVKQYDTIKQNVDSILRQAKQPEKDRTTER